VKPPRVPAMLAMFGRSAIPTVARPARGRRGPLDARRPDVVEVERGRGFTPKRIAAGGVGAFKRHPLSRAAARRRTTNSRSRPLYQAVARNSALVRRLWLDSRSMSLPAAIIVEGMPAARKAHKMRDQRRRVGTGPHRQRRRRAYVATFRFGKVRSSSPSACRAAASCPARHAS
jgi:hypothetical protein